MRGAADCRDLASLRHSVPHMSREGSIIGRRRIRVRNAPGRLAAALCVISLSTILITVVAIAQSYHVPRVAQRCSGNRQWAVASCRGQLRLLYFRVYDDVTVGAAEMMKSGWRLSYSYELPLDSNAAVVPGKGPAAASSSHILMGIEEVPFIDPWGFGGTWYDLPSMCEPTEPGFHSPGRRLRAVAAPYWPFTATAVIGAVLSGRRLLALRRKRRRVSAGRCPGCGYDLRRSPLRCPECGMEVSASRSNG